MGALHTRGLHPCRHGGEGEDGGGGGSVRGSGGDELVHTHASEKQKASRGDKGAPACAHASRSKQTTGAEEPRCMSGWGGGGRTYLLHEPHSDSGSVKLAKCPDASHTVQAPRTHGGFMGGDGKNREQSGRFVRACVGGWGRGGQEGWGQDGSLNQPGAVVRVPLPSDWPSKRIANGGAVGGWLSGRVGTMRAAPPLPSLPHAPHNSH